MVGGGGGGVVAMSRGNGGGGGGGVGPAGGQGQQHGVLQGLTHHHVHVEGGQLLDPLVQLL